MNFLKPTPYKQASANITPAQVKDLKKICAELRKLAEGFSGSGTKDESLLAEFIESDLKFHMAILQVVNNNQLVKMVENCRILSGIFNVYDLEIIDFRQAANICDEHDQIVTAIAAHAGSAAAKWIKKQIARSRKITMSSFEKLLEDNPLLNRPAPLAKEIRASNV